MKIDFKYDIEKDLLNYRNNFLDHRYPDYGRENLNINSIVPEIGKIDFESFEGDKTEYIQATLEDFYNKNESYFIDQLKFISTEWKKREKAYQKRLAEYFGVTIGFDATAYLTTLSIAPYNVGQKLFYVIMPSNTARQMNNIAHEYMHLVFRENFDEFMTQCGMDRQAILEINESLTVLIGLEFFDLFIVPDNNTKPSIQDLKEIVVKLWHEKKAFPEILEALIAARTPASS